MLGSWTLPSSARILLAHAISVEPPSPASTVQVIRAVGTEAEEPEATPQARGESGGPSTVLVTSQLARYMSIWPIESYCCQGRLTNRTLENGKREGIVRALAPIGVRFSRFIAIHTYGGCCKQQLVTVYFRDAFTCTKCPVERYICICLRFRE